jgi:phenylpropionate dioxygenase-like ring-hydroxylating dioxygenase large terminal subunit
MLSKEDNNLLTQTDAGTPMGELFRRFWLPAMLSDELPERDCEPVRLRLLGEDLIVFRDSNGRPGVLDAYCPHRGAALFFGRNELAGLRCIYHGWKFDVDGACVDLPNAPEGEDFRDRVHIKHYPAIEGAGMVWVFMGPKDRIPPRPGFDFMDVPSANYVVAKYYTHCNYLQALEGDLDPSHVSFLHSTLDGNRSNPSHRIFGRDGGSVPQVSNRAPRYEAFETEAGAAMINTRRLEEGKVTYAANHWVMPFYGLAGLAGPGVFPVNIKVPQDDHNTIYFRLRWSEQPLTDAARADLRIGGYVNPPLVPGTFEPKENKANDYLIDRMKQRSFSFSGMSQTAVQDTAMQENQRGDLMDRSLEVLVSSDKWIINVRHRLMASAQALAAGQEPPEPFNPQAMRIRNAAVTVPEGTDLEEAVAPILVAQARAEATELERARI